MNENFEKTLRELDIPASLHERCAMGARSAARAQRTARLRQLTAAAAATVCVLALSMPSIADSLRGFFSDIVRYDGAITGTAYAPGGDEILVSVSDGALEITFGMPDEIPFRLLEGLAVDAHILAADGSEILFTGEAEITDGTTSLILPALPAGTYTLTVDSLKGLSKADAPLEIRGTWHIEFSVH